ncbi:MAG: hypothetical protein M3379_22155 [Acidobacteriota bacterium]|nr:hypothetical protein [Acidobacteriota bacterium]
MKGQGISDVELEQIIPKAVKGSKKARKALLIHPWLHLLLNEVAEWAWRRYRVTHDEHGKDTQDVVYETIRDKITKLKNPHHVSWRACLRSFSYSVAKNHWRNYFDRGRRCEEEYQDSFEYEHTEGKRDGRSMIAPCSTILTEAEEREKESEEKREESLWENRIAQIDEALGRVSNSFTPEEKRIVLLWSQGKTLKQIVSEIAGETGSSIATVQRKLTRLEKRIMEELGKTVEELGKASGKEVGVEDILANLMEHRARGLRALVASSLQEMACSYAPHASV